MKRIYCISRNCVNERIFPLENKSRIDENKASLTETRSWILMQEFLLSLHDVTYHR